MPPYRLAEAPQQVAFTGFPPPAPIFAATSFWIVDDLPKDFRQMLIDTIMAATGTIVEDMMSAQYILSNPPYANQPWHVQYNKLRDERDSDHDPVPSVRPYYWIFDCLLSSPPRVLFASDIFSKAIFAQADGNGRRTPVRAYISINIPSTRPEDSGSGETAALNAEKLVLRHGGCRTLFRGRSEILILDTNTRQGGQYAEAAKSHQTVRTRDWIEQMVESKTSMGRDAASSAIKAKSLVQLDKKAKPARQEFTQADDDMIARYHAFAAPALTALKSLAFYNELLDDNVSHLYNWAHRHTAESWRERVRKREGFFRNKAEQYRDAGLDIHLSTRAERQAAGQTKDAEEDQRAPSPKGPRQSKRSVQHGQSTGGAPAEKPEESKKSATKRKADEVTPAAEVPVFNVTIAAQPSQHDATPRPKRPKPSAVDAGSSRRDLVMAAEELAPSPARHSRASTSEQVPMATKSAAISAMDDMQVDEDELPSTAEEFTTSQAIHEGTPSHVPAVTIANSAAIPVKPDAHPIRHNRPRRLAQVDVFADDWESPPVPNGSPAPNAQKVGSRQQGDANKAQPRITPDADVDMVAAGPTRGHATEEVVGYIVEESVPAGRAQAVSAADGDSDEDSDAEIERDIAAARVVLAEMGGQRRQTEVRTEPSAESRSMVQVTASAVSPGKALRVEAVGQGRGDAGDESETLTAKAQNESSDTEMEASQDAEDNEPSDTLDMAAQNFFAAKRLKVLPPVPPEDLPARKRLSLGLPLQIPGRQDQGEGFRPGRQRSHRDEELDVQPRGSRTESRSSPETGSFQSHSAHALRPHRLSELNNAGARTPQHRSRKSASSPSTPNRSQASRLAEVLCRKHGISIQVFVKLLEGLVAGGRTVDTATISVAIEQYEARH